MQGRVDVLAYINFTGVFGLKVDYRISSICELGLVGRSKSSNHCASRISLDTTRMLFQHSIIPFMVLPALAELLQGCCQ